MPTTVLLWLSGMQSKAISYQTDTLKCVCVCVPLMYTVQVRTACQMSCTHTHFLSHDIITDIVL